MIKGLCAILLISLLVVAQCQSFKRIPFDQGKVNVGRNLAELSRTKINATYLPVSAVDVTFSEAFRTGHEIAANAETAMTVLLHTSHSGFCKNCENTYFRKFECKEAYCKLDTKADRIISNSDFKVTWAYGIASEAPLLKIGSGEGSWELKNNALEVENSYVYPSTSYFKNNRTYGFIGLGVEGNAAANFKTGDHPVFSIKTSRDGQGEIVFGVDASLYDAKQKSQVLSASTNWTLEAKNYTCGTKNGTKNTRIFFDLNKEGLYIPSDIYNPLFTEIVTIAKGNFRSNATTGETFNYLYNGSLSVLPDIVLGLTNGQELRIPPFAYMRAANGSDYRFIVTATSWFNDYEGHSVYETIIGTSVLSQFYAVFEVPKEKTPTITLWPTPTGVLPTPNTGGGSGFLIGVIAVVGLAAVGYIVFKNKAASKLQEQLNPK